ncbi:MAG: phosphoribosylformylglycinamidine cyclo-ligase [Candidatus Omnitrophica bacterium]|nr:phosphoribosylformylglycinamidine cyclo-ligase [Candidatus Omnitrophota bacterium]
MKDLTYKKSGVDIDKAALFKLGIKNMARKSFRKEVLKDIGGFGAFFKLSKIKYKDPVLVSSSDGVGTKLKIAQLAGKHDTVGIDLVAMNVNDILCVAAEPLFFLDYIAYSKVATGTLSKIVLGINNGCIQAGCSLIGGETAQMPDMYKAGEYDLAGFCVGIAEKKNIIDGKNIKSGDMLIGLESNGLHSNGFSLVRKVFSLSEQERMSKELLKPTRIYVKPILSLLRTAGAGRQAAIKGISHITGGAFFDKISRILPGNVDAVVKKDSWRVPGIFRLIQEKGGISFLEMHRTFNMGIGMVLVVDRKFAFKIKSRLEKLNLRSWIIGEIAKGAGKTVFSS